MIHFWQPGLELTVLVLKHISFLMEIPILDALKCIGFLMEVSNYGSMELIPTLGVLNLHKPISCETLKSSGKSDKFWSIGKKIAAPPCKIRINDYIVGMHIRILKQNKDGKEVRYLSLAESVRVPGKKSPTKRIIHNFGVDSEDVRRKLESLVANVRRYLSEEDSELALEGLEGMKLAAAYNYGLMYLVRQLWQRTGMNDAVRSRCGRQESGAPHATALLAMVAQRLSDPGSKLRCHEQWLKSVWFPEAQDLSLGQLYRALDMLAEHGEAIEEEVFWRTASLFDLEVDLVFYDGTSVWFEVGDEDQKGEAWNGKIFEPLRKRGHSKEGRDNDPQMIVALAVTQDGVPVRSWIFPGNTPDVKTVERVKSDLRGMKLNRVIFVGDSGMYSKANLETLEREAGRFIIATPVGRVKEIREDVLSHPGRFTEITDNLRAKEVVLGTGADRRRYVLCVNDSEAARNRHRREQLLEDLESELSSMRDGHSKKSCKLLSSKRYSRYLSEDESGRLKIDPAKVRRAERTDGKYVLLTNDESLTVHEIATSYKGMWIIESCFRRIKTSGLNIRPVFHWTPRRIVAHVRLCVLSLMIQRIAELRTGKTWRNISDAVENIKAVQVSGKKSSIVLTSNITSEAVKIFKNLDIPRPTSHDDS